MHYKVMVSFRWNGMVRMPGQLLSLSLQEAARLVPMRLVARAEQAVRPPAEGPASPVLEQAVSPPAETRKSPRKGHSKKVQDVATESDAASD